LNKPRKTAIAELVKLEAEIAPLLTVYNQKLVDGVIENYTPSGLFQGSTHVIVSFCNETDETNPEITDIFVRVHILDPRMPQDNDGNLLEAVNLSDISQPLEQRLAFACRHVLEEYGLPMLTDSPPVKNAGKQVTVPIEEAN
jgi:hypothetical protein